MDKKTIMPGIVYTEISTPDKPLDGKIRRGIINYKEITQDIIPGVKPYYSISDTGIVETVSTGYRQEMALNETKEYQYVNMSRENQRPKTMRIHRLVATMFTYNNNKPERNKVNHIDGNPLNNDYTNLEMVTTKENNNHAYDMGLRPTLFSHQQLYFIANRLENGMSDKEIFSLFKESFPESSITFTNLNSVTRSMVSKSAYKEFTENRNFPSRSNNLFTEEHIRFVANQLSKGISDKEIFLAFKDKFNDCGFEFIQIKRLANSIQSGQYKDILHDFNINKRRNTLYTDEQILFVKNQKENGIRTKDIYDVFIKQYPDSKVSREQIKNLVGHLGSGRFKYLFEK